MTRSASDDIWLLHQHGPLVPLVLNVGVTGPLPHKLTDQGGALDYLEPQLRGVLTAIASEIEQIRLAPRTSLLYRTDLAAVCRILSPLAEGVDRLTASLAVEIGFELVSPLPFASEEYEKDFAPGISQANPKGGTIDAYRNILAAAVPVAQASRIVELDGDPDDRPAAYEMCGRFVVRHADLMIAVWNGAAPEHEAGTAVTVAEAYNQSVPLICIDAARPHAISLVPSRADGSAKLRTMAAFGNLSAEMKAGRRYDTWNDSSFRQALREALEEVLVPTEILGPGKHRLSQFVRERGISVSPDMARDDRRSSQSPIRLSRGWPGPLAGLFSLLQTVVAPRRSVEKRRRESRLEVEVQTSAPVVHMATPAVGRIFAAFLRADMLGSHYARCYRSLFMLIYLLGASALVCAVGAIYFQGSMWFGVDAKYLLTSIELVVLVLVVMLVWSDRRLHLHERWIDYRLVAELLRHMLYLPLVGDTGSRGRIRARALETVDPKSETTPGPRCWTFLYFESISRFAGVVGARYDREYLDRVRTHVSETHIARQLDYHGRTAARAELIASRLGWISLGLFACTVAAASAKLLFPELAHRIGAGFLAGLFPALAAASFGIRSHAEFEIVNKRSRSIFVRLEREREILLRTPNLQSDTIRDAFRGVADTMLTEAADWADIFEEKETETG